jgi:hypothetical protein
MKNTLEIDKNYYEYLDKRKERGKLAEETSQNNNKQHQQFQQLQQLLLIANYRLYQ